MKKYSKDELQKMAEELYFSKNDALEAMLATEDGNFFYPNAAGYARNHAKGRVVHVLSRKKSKAEEGQKDNPSKKAKKSESKSSKPMKISKNDLIKKIKSAKTEDELDELEDEFNISSSKDEDVLEAFEEKEMSLI